MWMGMRRVREGVGGIKLIGRKDLFVFEGAGISCSIFFSRCILCLEVETGLDVGARVFVLCVGTLVASGLCRLGRG